MRTTLALLCVVGLALPAQAHDEAATQEWMDDWLQRVELEVGITIDLMLEWQDFKDRHPEPIILPTQRRTTYAGGIEQWRSLVEQYFPASATSWAMRVIACESNGDPNAKNPRSTASGLFQHLASYWPERSAKAGWAGADIFNPEANVAVAAWLYSWGGSSHWVCK